MTLKTYVEYLLPGIFMSEEETKEIKNRDVKLALKQMPKACFTFKFYDVETIEQNGEVLRGKAKNHSGWYYPDAEKIHWKKIPDTPENSILISNVKGNGLGGYGIKTRIGNWQWLQEGDIIFSTKENIVRGRPLDLEG